jgi:RWD domain
MKLQVIVLVRLFESTVLTNCAVDISDTAYRISIALDVINHDGGDLDPPVLILQISYPDKYPDVAPHVEISAPPNAPKYPHLNVQEDRAHLLETLEPIIEENLGMAMIFALVDSLKQGAELLIAGRQAAVQAMKEFEAAKAEEEENRKFHGTAVTKESFVEWRTRFQREMEEEERRQEERDADEKSKKKAGTKEEKRLTGKQLWERGLAAKGDYDEGDDDLLPEKLEKLDLIS